MKRLLRRLHHWWHRERLEAELAEELEGHRREVQQAFESRGLRTDEAARASRRRLGNATLAREDARQVWTWVWLESVWQDARYAFRTLRRDKAFALIALATLALGIGATTAIFSVVYALALRPLPYGDPSELVAIHTFLPSGMGSMSSNGLAVLTPGIRSFSGIAAERLEGSVWTTPTGIRRIANFAATTNLFDVLEARPLLGRTFGSQDAGTRVAVLAHEWWISEYAADPSVIGRNVRLDDDDYKIIGVMPADFRFPYSGTSTLWIQADSEARHAMPRSRDWRSVARLRPAVTLGQAQRELDVIAARIAAADPDANQQPGLRAVPLLEDTVGSMRPQLLALMAAVVLVLLIACVNVASLLLTRGAARERELAVRAALGAARSRLVRQLVTEGVLLGLAGGTAGVLAAKWTRGTIVGLIPAGIPRAGSIAIDWPIWIFAAAIALMTGLVCGMAPALRLWSDRVHHRLQQGSPLVAGPRSQRPGQLFILAETTLSIVLLVGAGLMIRSFTLLIDQPLGFDPKGLMTVLVSLPDGRLSNQWNPEVYRTLLESMRTIPGVRAVSAGSAAQIGGFAEIATPQFDDRPETSEDHNNDVVVQSQLPGYFETMGIAIDRGRDFTAGDRVGGPQVAIVNEALARRFFAGSDPLGHRIHVPSPAGWSEIVGVVADTKYHKLDREDPPQAYFPLLQRHSPLAEALFVARLEPGSRVHSEELQKQIRAISRAGLRIGDVSSMEQWIGQSVEQTRFQTVVLGVFGTMALLLSVVGIFGVTSYAVTQRVREIGVRMALGASAGHILRMVMGHSSRPIIAGIALGLLAAVLATKALGAFLFQITTTDVPTYIGIAVLFAATAAIAAAIPAHRATQVDPVITLRQE